MGIQGSDAQAALREAQEQARRLAELERQRAEEARKRNEEALKNGQTPVPVPEDRLGVVEKDTFVNDPAIAEKLGKSKDELAVLFDEASRLDGVDGLSDDEMASMFLAVAQNRQVSEFKKPGAVETPAAPGTAEKPDEDKTEEKPGPGAVEKATQTMNAIAKAEKDLKKIGVEVDNAVLEKYRSAKKKVDLAEKAGKADPQAIAELTSVATEMLNDLTTRSYKTPEAKSAAGEFLRSIQTDLSATKTGKTGMMMASEGSDKVSKVIALFGTVSSLYTGLNSDGKPLDAEDLVKMPMDIQAALSDLSGGAGAKELTSLYKLMSRNLTRQVVEYAKPLKLDGAVKAADRFIRATLNKASALEKGAQEFVEESVKKMQAFTRLSLGRVGYEKLASALSKAAVIMEGANLAMMGATYLYHALDTCLQGYVQARGAITNILDKSSSNKKWTQLLENYTEAESSFKQSAADLRAEVGKPGFDALKADMLKEAKDFNVAAVTDLLRMDRGVVQTHRQDAVEQLLRDRGVMATLPNGTQVSAADLFARLRTSGQNPAVKPLSDDEHLALAQPLAGAAREVILDDMVVNKADDFEGLKPEHLTLEVAQKMDLLQLKGHLGGLSGAELDRIPLEVRKYAYDQAAGGKMDQLEADIATSWPGQAIGMTDARHPFMGKVLASMLRTTAPGPNADKTAPATLEANQKTNALMAWAQSRESGETGIFSTNKALLIAETVKHLRNEDLRQLPTETLQTIGDIASTGVLYSKDENVEIAVRAAEAIRAKGGADDGQRADAIENRFWGENSDDVLEFRLKAMTDDEIKRRPAPEQGKLLVGLMQNNGILSAGEKEQTARLLRGMIDAPGQQTPTHNLEAALAGMPADRRPAIVRELVNALTPEQLDAMPTAAKQKLGDALVGSSGSIYDVNTEAAMKLSNSMRRSNNLRPGEADLQAAADLERRARGTVTGAQTDNVAHHRVATALDENLQQLSMGEQEQLIRDLASKGGAREQQDMARLLGLASGADGKSLNPQESARRYEVLLAAVPEAQRPGVARAMANSLSTEQLQALPEAVRRSVAGYVEKQLTAKPDQASFQAAYKLERVLPDDAKAWLGGRIEEVGKTVDGGIKQLGRLDAMTDAELEAFVKTGPDYKTILTDLDNHYLPNAARDAAKARLIGAGHAEARRQDALALTNGQKQDTQATFMKEALGHLGSTTQDNVVSLMIAGMEKKELQATYSKDTLEQMFNAARQGLFGSDADAVRRLETAYRNW